MKPAGWSPFPVVNSYGRRSRLRISMRSTWPKVLAGLVALPGIVSVTVMALLMNATGIELDSGRDIDLDAELRSVGIQNLVAGAGGGTAQTRSPR